MRVTVFSEALIFSVAFGVTTAIHDYQPLRQPTIFESDCAKQWAKLNENSLTRGSSDSDDLSTAEYGNGELQVNLSVQLKRFTSNYVDFNTRSFNGLVPGPTIKVCPGDRLIVTLTNSLGAGGHNNTNIHVHGMHVPPRGDADNVIPTVRPGEQRTYIYDIQPDHPAGTFWYHPHKHGNVNSQLNGMMAGALIVADRPADFPTELAATDDLVMILQAICVENCHNVNDNLQFAIENRYSSSSASTMQMDTVDEESQRSKVWLTDLEIVENDADVPLNDTSLLTLFVNGQYLPALGIMVGEYKRLRLVNAIANNIAELVTTRDSSCTLTVLSMDSIYFAEPKAKDVIVIPPGGRADVVIRCAKIGVFYLETDCASSRSKVLGGVNQHRVPSQRIVKINVRKEDEGSDDNKRHVATSLVSTLPKRPPYMENTLGSARHASSISVSNKYDFEFSVWMENGTMMYGVNHKTLDMAYINHSMPVNEVQEWKLSVKDYRDPAIGSCDPDDAFEKSSKCRTMNHPFHIHSTHFQVSDMDIDTDPDGVMFEVGEWRDTLPLFRGKVWIRFTPRDYMLGNILAHCHMASHGDAGMSQLVNVHAGPDQVEAGEEEVTSSTSDSVVKEDDEDDDEVEEMYEGGSGQGDGEAGAEVGSDAEELDGEGEADSESDAAANDGSEGEEESTSDAEDDGSKREIEEDE
uniref:Multicopper oxidase n=1 Tax=Peronospora matthiolae TaxID=2874970 RepID=A0AAV1TH07_9STRA